MKELRDHLQYVADAAGQPDQQEAFAERYSELLAELKGGLEAMRRLATMQMAWLRARIGTDARNN